MGFSDGILNVVQSRVTKKSFFKFNILLNKSISTTKTKRANRINKNDLKMGSFSNGIYFMSIFFISTQTLKMFGNWTEVDKKKYKKKKIGIRFILLILKGKLRFFIRIKETIIKSSKWALNIKFPIINEMGKVQNNISTNFISLYFWFLIFFRLIIRL